MSVLTAEEVARIAHLARLALEDDEVQLFARQLTSILDYAEQLREVDTGDVAPTSHPLAISAPFREDLVTPFLPADDLTAAAPDAGAGLFKVPRVLGA